MLSSSFSASVQALCSTCWRNLFTSSLGIVGDCLSASFCFVFLADIRYTFLRYLEQSLSFREIRAGDKSRNSDWTASRPTDEYSSVTRMRHDVATDGVDRVCEERIRS